MTDSFKLPVEPECLPRMILDAIRELKKTENPVGSYELIECYVADPEYDVSVLVRLIKKGQVSI